MGKKIFISHATLDGKTINDYQRIFHTSEDDELFFSSDASKGVKAGEGITARINKELPLTDIYVFVISDNFLRSSYCLYELNVATFLHNENRRYVLLANKPANYEKIRTTINHLDLLYLNAENEEDFNTKFLDIFKEAKREDVEAFRKEFCGLNKSTNPYIGMDKSFYEGVVSYCERNNIVSFGNNPADSKVLVNKIKTADEVIILSTTAASLSKMAANGVVEALENGTKFKIIIPNQYSSFLEDVAKLERPEDSVSRIDGLAKECEETMNYFIESYNHASGENKGTVEYYCALNALRQTITLIKEGNRFFLVLTLTMPPLRTIDGTPTLVIDGEIENNEIYKVVNKHLQSIMAYSKQNGCYKNIDSSSKPSPFFLEKKNAKEYWEDKLATAKKNMAKYQRLLGGALIEIAAQHPLLANGKPDFEFAARLDKGAELYLELKAKGEKVKIYVPGSIHMYEDIVDPVSLSTSGKTYLMEKGIVEEDIYADEMNKKYKEEDGVYNSSDECYVASKIFFDNKFSSLLSVCSPSQVMRKTLYYLESGIYPMCYSVPVDGMFHSPIEELLVALDNVLYHDHDGQNKEGEVFINSRKERKP